MTGPSRRWSRIFRSDAREEVEEELRFHLEERIREYEARGLDAESARSAALERLGDVERARVEATKLLVAERRSEARRDWLRVSWIDVKLGFRLLRKYPGLTVVGGLAMAFAIAVGAAGFEAIMQLARPQLPFEDGDRIVGIRQWDARTNRSQGPYTRDFLEWRGQLRSIEQVGAFRIIERNLIIEGRGSEPVKLAEMSAVAFAVAGVAPVRGRTLTAEDELHGAPTVIVIGHDVWQQRFGGDPDILGRVVHLGRDAATVVGVMPQGFAFPIAEEAWIPLRPATLAGADPGPRLGVFGSLAPGATLEQARAELDAIGARVAADRPDTHDHMRPQVNPYAATMFPVCAMMSPCSIGEQLLFSGNSFFLAFLLLVCANVALLMFARAATRESEIVVRSALGASRARIVTQLVTEALVLGSIAAVIGIAAAGFALRVAIDLVEHVGGTLPFWFSPSLSPSSIVYAVVLTVLGGIVAGVLPALKITRSTGAQLRRVGAGAGGPSFGGVWNVVIVAQVACTVVAVGMTIYTVLLTARIAQIDLGLDGGHVLTARLALPRQELAVADSGAPAGARLHDLHARVEERMLEEADVLGVSFASHLPGTYHSRRTTEVEVGEGIVDRIQFAAVEPGFFDALGVQLVAGRKLRPSDVDSDVPVVVVNESFVEDVLGGRNAIGQRVRFTQGDAAEAAPWHEIVGVVRDVLLTNDPELPHNGGIYHPAAVSSLGSVHLLVRVRGDADALSPRLRAIVAAVDPELRVHDVRTLEGVRDAEVRWYVIWIWIALGSAGVVVALALAGIYAVTSFTVSRRTREIGIRLALGADSRRIIVSTFARPLSLAALGVVLPVAVLAALDGGIANLRFAAILSGYTLLMFGIVLLGCLVPLRRALRIEPMDALRTDG